MNIIKRIVKTIKQWFIKEEKEEITEYCYNENDLDLEAFTKNYSPPLVQVFKRSTRKIDFEFIPEKQNFRNVRSALQFLDGDWKSWKTIRDAQEAKSNGVCCICGCKSQDIIADSKTATECHEVWSFNGNIQKLERLEPLCVQCHQIKHINRFSTDQDYTDKLLARYCELNDITMPLALEDLEKAKQWKINCKNLQYSLDMSLMNEIYRPETFKGLFDCHSPDFNYFVDTEFKKNKNTEE